MSYTGGQYCVSCNLNEAPSTCAVNTPGGVLRGELPFNIRYGMYIHVHVVCVYGPELERIVHAWTLKAMARPKKEPQRSKRDVYSFIKQLRILSS